jgi:hypothetical protein
LRGLSCCKSVSASPRAWRKKRRSANKFLPSPPVSMTLNGAAAMRWRRCVNVSCNGKTRNAKPASRSVKWRWRTNSGPMQLRRVQRLARPVRVRRSKSGSLRVRQARRRRPCHLHKHLPPCRRGPQRLPNERRLRLNACVLQPRVTLRRKPLRLRWPRGRLNEQRAQSCLHRCRCPQRSRRVQRR